MFRLTSCNALIDHLTQFQDVSFTMVEDIAVPLDRLGSLADGTFTRCEFAGGTTMPETMANALFVDCKMTDLRFRRVNLFGAQFIRCDLSRSTFLECDLSAAQFVDCDLSTSVFSDCEIDAALVSGRDAGGAGLAA